MISAILTYIDVGVFETVVEKVEIQNSVTLPEFAWIYELSVVHDVETVEDVEVVAVANRILRKVHRIIHEVHWRVLGVGPVVKVCDLNHYIGVTYVHIGMVVAFLLEHLGRKFVETDEIRNTLVFLLNHQSVHHAFSRQ